MPILIAFAILFLLKYFDDKVPFMQQVSWWWVVGAAVLGFLWFEYFERMLGLDKKQGDMQHEKMKKERLKRNFDPNKRK